MHYGTAESEIVSILNTWFEEHSIDTFFEAKEVPETEEEVRAFNQNFLKARVAVQYIGSTYQTSKSQLIVTQPERVRFRLTFEARRLRGESGLYTFLQQVKFALVGQKITGSTPFAIVAYDVIEMEQNRVQPFLEFECEAVTPQIADNYTEPPLGGENSQNYSGLNEPRVTYD